LLKKIINQGILEGVFHQVDVEVFALNVLYLLPSVFTRSVALFDILTFPFDDKQKDETLEGRVINYLMSSLSVKEVKLTVNP
jgi:hypothetical protein